MGKSIENNLDEEIDFCYDAVLNGIVTNDWEESFIVDMNIKRKTNAFFTDKQIDKLLQIYQKLKAETAEDEEY